LAQLVARFVHTEEVIGSSPVSPTLTKARSRQAPGLRRSGSAWLLTYDGRMSSPLATGASVPARFFSGVRLLGSGLRMWITDPRIMLMGALPALIVAVVYLAGFIVLAANAEAIAGAVTPFARDWGETMRTVVRAAATIALIGVALLLVVYTFTAVTLAIGSPFYERISRKVEARLGGIDSPVELAFWPGLGRGILDGLRVLVATLGVAVLLFAFGFIPVIGQTVVPVLGALAGGWFIALELSGFAFEARAITGTQKRRMLRADRAATLGFGVATYLVFFIPFAAVITMPAAVAGGTMLARTAIARADDAERATGTRPGEVSRAG
jgi:CysZ protein